MNDNYGQYNDDKTAEMIEAIKRNEKSEDNRMIGDWQGDKKRDRVAKIILVVFSFFLVSVIFLWSKTLNKSINQPFKTYSDSDNSAISDDNQDARKIDTDRDGLSDYNESNVYGTSPYLEDTDGDGYKDGDEVLSGTDPNCAAGSSCNAKQSSDTGNVDAANPGSASNSGSTLLPSTGSGDTSVGTEDEGPFLDRGVSTSGTPTSTNASSTISSDTNDIGRQVISGKADPKILRQLLKESGGLSEAQLNLISDEDLIKTYQEVLSQPISGQ